MAEGRARAAQDRLERGDEPRVVGVVEGEEEVLEAVEPGAPDGRDGLGREIVTAERGVTAVDPEAAEREPGGRREVRGSLPHLHVELAQEAGRAQREHL